MPSRLSSRIEVCPPKTWPSSLTLLGRAQRWLNRGNPWAPEPSRPVNRLGRVKDEFQRGLDGLGVEHVAALLDQIERARSLRELWHLRPPLYGVLAVHLDQAEADRRLAEINRHFPTRVPRRSVHPQFG